VSREFGRFRRKSLTSAVVEDAGVSVDFAVGIGIAAEGDLIVLQGMLFQIGKAIGLLTLMGALAGATRAAARCARRERRRAARRRTHRLDHR